MAKHKLIVKTAVGEFTRTTARTYTHLVVVKGYRAERLEASRLAAIQEARKNAAKYRRTIETGQCQDARPGASGDWDREMAAKFLAEGEYQKWLASEEAEEARLVAMGPITQDADSWGLNDANLNAAPEPFVLGWCGRLDLARKLAQGTEATRYREVWIFEVATGLEAK